MRLFLPIEESQEQVGPAGFTLVELLVSMAILLVMIVVLLQIIANMSSVWVNSTGSISNFQEARAAFTVINRELARATLATYLDYINNPAVNNSPFGQFRTSLTSSSQQAFVPYGFARASELHFVCGPASLILPGAAAATNPGDVIFFQAPLGTVNVTNDKYLPRSLNDVGFYLQYSDLASSAFPAWSVPFFGSAPHYGYRLIECVEPTENLSVYQQTSSGTYSLGWLPAASSAPFPSSGTTYSESILAEGVVLLIFRPRLEPIDEQIAAIKVGTTYSSTTQNSIISPNYVYDSRTWQTGYSFSATTVKSSAYGLLMRNQLPPIVDVAMVCVDPTSLLRLGVTTQTTPSATLKPSSTLFSNSANMDTDLATYGQQLSALHLRYRIFRSSVQIQAAAWVNE